MRSPSRRDIGQSVRVKRAVRGSEAGGAVEIVLASFAVVIALVALLVAVTRDSGSGQSVAVTTTTLSAQRVCEARRAAYSDSYESLDRERKSLRSQEKVTNDMLLHALQVNSPNIGVIDAEHQAVLRQFSDLEQRILKLEAGKAADACTSAAP